MFISRGEAILMPDEPSWKVIHMVRGRQAAQKILACLREEGYPVRLVELPEGASREDDYYQIAVPGFEAAECRDLLLERNLLLGP